MRNGQSAMTVIVPPFELNHIFESKIGYQIKYLVGDNHGGGIAAAANGLLHDGAQRGAMQVIEMRVRYKNHINGRQIAHPHSRAPQTLQHEQPARKVRIDQNILSTDLNKKAGMAYKSDSQLAITHQPGPMDHADSRRHSGVPHQAPKLPRSLAERRITQRVLEHESVMMPPCACPLPSIIVCKKLF